MGKYEALGRIKITWENESMALNDKILSISNDYYSVGLDLQTTAAFINATPAEFDAFLSLSNLDDDLIAQIGKINPPKTTWALLTNAGESEIRQALNVLATTKEIRNDKMANSSVSEFVYHQMLEVAPPTPEKLVGMLSGDELGVVYKKAKDFGCLDKWLEKFFPSIIAQKKKGRTLTNKQIYILVDSLISFADRGVIKRNSIDGDEEICDKVLDAIGK